MKKTLLMLFSFVLLFSACNKDEELATPPTTTTEGKSAKNARLYTIKTVNKPTTRAVAETDKLWEPGSVIKIKFLTTSDSYDPTVESKVKQYAEEWRQYANIKFEYVAEHEEADVKIGFEWGEEFAFVTWSTIGTDSKLVPQNEASLNFVALIDEDETFIRAEVLRGFGHILGLGFEHKTPESPIEFKYNTTTDKRRLEGYFGMGFIDILDQIIPLYSADQTNYTEYDIESIMILPIPGTLLTNPKFGVYQNAELSETDKKFIAELYPKYYVKPTGIKGDFYDGLEYNGKIYLTESCVGIISANLISKEKHTEMSYLLCLNMFKANNTFYVNRSSTSGKKEDDRISQFDANSNTFITNNSIAGLINSSFKASDGTHYFGCSKTGILYIDKNTHELKNKDINIPIPPDNHVNILSIVEDADGIVYFAGNYRPATGFTQDGLFYLDTDGEIKLANKPNPFKYAWRYVFEMNGKAHYSGDTELGYFTKADYTKLGDITARFVANNNGSSYFTWDREFFSLNSLSLAKTVFEVEPLSDGTAPYIDYFKPFMTAKGVFLRGSNSEGNVNSLYYVDNATQTLKVIKQALYVRNIFETSDNKMYLVCMHTNELLELIFD